LEIPIEELRTEFCSRDDNKGVCVELLIGCAYGKYWKIGLPRLPLKFAVVNDLVLVTGFVRVRLVNRS